MRISIHCNNLKPWDVNRIRNEEDKQIDQQIVSERATRNREIEGKKQDIKKIR